MNSTKTQNLKYGSSNNLEEPRTTPRQEPSLETDPSAFTELPRRASAMTSVLMEMLTRSHGVARWGLNE